MIILKWDRMDLLKKIEEQFNVIYPDNPNATYSSVLNFSDDLNKPFQRWFRYKEGFSIDLIKKIINDNQLEAGVILDPFSGSGTTLIASSYNNISSIGFEVNPFSYFMSKVKTTNYTDMEVEEFENNIINVVNNDIKCSDLPEREMMKKVFSKQIEKDFLRIKFNIHNLKLSENVKKLFFLGLISLIEVFSNYKKSGNGLKKRNVKVKYEEKNNFLKELNSKYINILEDIKSDNVKFNTNIIYDSCLSMEEYIDDNSIDGVIFSPPYANCFDYTEIYKLELWFGDFVTNSVDLKKLRHSSLRSHLNSNLKEKNDKTLQEIEHILEELLTKNLWDKRIPIMIKSYFHDMFLLLDKLYISLKTKGFCNIIVSNSAYGGIVIPTDLFISIYAESIGFIVERIEVDRYIITSSQQYKSTLEYKKYLRESIICLRKK